MNHPKREEWIPYLYGEVEPQVRRELKAHLESCEGCRAELTAWKGSLKRLDAWKLPPTRRQPLLPVPSLGWSVAAATLLVLGFLAGLSMASKSEVKSLRATIEPKLRHELTAQLTRVIREEVNKAAARMLARAEEQSAKAVAGCAATLESKHTQDYREVHAALLVLKEQLDTVAMNTDAGLRQAEQRLVQLADYQPEKKSSQQ